MTDLHTTTVHRCVRCQCPLEAMDLRCVVCRLQAPVRMAEQRSVAQILRCEQCGAAVAYDETVQAPKCAFCACVMHVEIPSDPLEEAEQYLPFRVSPADATGAMRSFLGSLGFFRPSDLATAAVVEGLKPLYWTGWLVDADALVSYAGDSEVGAMRARWAPHAGQHEMSLRNVLVPGTRGLSALEVAKLAPGFDVSSGTPEPRERPVVVERFDVTRSAARRTIVQAIDQAALAAADRFMPGSSARNLKVETLLRGLTTRRLAFPTYVLAYRYRDASYRVLVHGQTASIVFGDAPLSIPKVVGAVVALGFVLAIVAAMIASHG